MEKNNDQPSYKGPFDLGDLTVGPNGIFGPRTESIKKEEPEKTTDFCSLCKRERPTYENGTIVPCDMCRILGCLH